MSARWKWRCKPAQPTPNPRLAPEEAVWPRASEVTIRPVYHSDAACMSVRTPIGPTLSLSAALLTFSPTTRCPRAALFAEEDRLQLVEPQILALERPQPTDR